jgi:drug/metabolite transporter (DMT)-like permease
MFMSFVAMLAYSWRQLWTANRKELLTWMIVPGFFAGMLISSLYTYEFISLSLLTVVRNLAPLVVLPIESMVMPAGKGPKITLSVVASILTMLFGAVVYAGGLTGISWVGIMFAVLNMALAVSDRMIQRRLLSTDCSSLSLETCTVMTNFFGMFPTVGIAYFTNELSTVTAPKAGVVSAWADPRVLVLLLISGAIGLGICYFGFACQREISATSFMVLQNTSKVAVVAMGVVFFQDPIKSPFMVLGLLMSIGGSFMYGKAQMDIAEESKMEKAKLLEKEEAKEQSA